MAIIRTMAALAVCGVIAACGGQEDKTTPDENRLISTATPKNVNIVNSLNNCLTSHNADAEVDFLLQDKLAMYLEWNCGDHLQHHQRHVRVFFKYDYDLQCYVETSTHVDFGRCRSPAPVPATPLAGLRIVDFTVRDNLINEQGLPGFSYAATLENNGNIPAFDVDITVNIDNNAGGNREVLPLIEPGETARSLDYDAYGVAFRGQQFNLELIVRDAYGQLIGVRHATVRIN